MTNDECGLVRIMKTPNSKTEGLCVCSAGITFVEDICWTNEDSRHEKTCMYVIMFFCLTNLGLYGESRVKNPSFRCRRRSRDIDRSSKKPSFCCVPLELLFLQQEERPPHAGGWCVMELTDDDVKICFKSSQ